MQPIKTSNAILTTLFIAAGMEPIGLKPFTENQFTTSMSERTDRRAICFRPSFVTGNFHLPHLVNGGYQPKRFSNLA